MAKRPGLVEALVVWGLLGYLAVAVFVTYARLPPEDLFRTDVGGLAGGAGRTLVLLNYPVSLVAIGLAAVAAARLGSRLGRELGALAAVLCTVSVLPGVIDEHDLDARLVNAVPALGVALAACVTIAAARSKSVGSFGRLSGDRARLALGTVLFVVAIPWLTGEWGLYADDVPGLGFFMSSEPTPEPEDPNLTAVHLGHHHGMDGVLLAWSALLLTRVLPSLARAGPRRGMGLYLSLMLVYGLAIGAEDAWNEQLVKRGWIDWKLPSVVSPSPIEWVVLIVAAAATYLVFFRLRRRAAPSPV